MVRWSMFMSGCNRLFCDVFLRMGNAEITWGEEIMTVRERPYEDGERFDVCLRMF